MRVDYAVKLLPILDEKQLEMTVFVDETTEEESPHPKGKCGFTAVHACVLHGLVANDIYQ